MKKEKVKNETVTGLTRQDFRVIEFAMEQITKTTQKLVCEKASQLIYARTQRAKKADNRDVPQGGIENMLLDEMQSLLDILEDTSRLDTCCWHWQRPDQPRPELPIPDF